MIEKLYTFRWSPPTVGSWHAGGLFANPDLELIRDQAQFENERKTMDVRSMLIYEIRPSDAQFFSAKNTTPIRRRTSMRLRILPEGDWVYTRRAVTATFVEELPMSEDAVIELVHLKMMGQLLENRREHREAWDREMKRMPFPPPKK